MIESITSNRLATRSKAVFVVGLILLVALWLPPLPYTIKVASFPQPLLLPLLKSGLVKPTQTWPLRWDHLAALPLLIYALWVIWRSRLSLSECGLTRRQFLGALKLLAWPTIVGGILLLLLGACCHSIQITDRFWKRLIPIPALFQQMVCQLFFHRQLMPWFGSGRKTAWVLTLYFVALHTPNIGLMMGTLFGMYFWARCYQQQSNLYAISISHALLSALLMHTMPKTFLPSVSVGWRFVEKVW